MIWSLREFRIWLLRKFDGYANLEFALKSAGRDRVYKPPLPLHKGIFKLWILLAFYKKRWHLLTASRASATKFVIRNLSLVINKNEATILQLVTLWRPEKK